MSKFTAALGIDGTDLHVTVCFCDAVKAGKFRTSTHAGSGTIVKVEYWEQCDLTVAIVDSNFAFDRHEYYKLIGYGYDHEFIPHATLGSGNLVSEYSGMIGREIVLSGESARIY